MIARLYAFAALIALSGCITPEKCAERYPPNAPEVRTRVVTDSVFVDPFLYVFTDTVDCPPALVDTLRIFRDVARTIPGRTVYVDRIERDTVVQARYCEPCAKCPKGKREKAPSLWLFALLGAVAGFALAYYIETRISKRKG